MARNDAQWARVLNAAYAAYHSETRRRRDPIELVYRYEHAEDREIAAFLVSQLAYGNVATICASATRMLAVLGDRPAARLLERGDFPEISPFRHRFTTGDDLRVVLATLHTVLKTHGSLEGFFLAAGKKKCRSPGTDRTLC